MCKLKFSIIIPFPNKINNNFQENIVAVIPNMFNNYKRLKLTETNKRKNNSTDNSSYFGVPECQFYFQ